ncbi:MAG TPA: nuclear transport factor 2 family protein [Terriglobales bacterium]
MTTKMGVLMLVAMLAATAAPAQTKSGDQGKAVAEAWVAAWNSHDPDKFLSAFTSDVTYEDTTSIGGAYHGTAEVRKFVADEIAAVPDLKLELVRGMVNNGHGTIEWVFSGTDKDIYKTGKKFSVRGVSVVDVKDGKISRCLDFYDAATIMKQVGVAPK